MLKPNKVEEKNYTNTPPYKTAPKVIPTPMTFAP
jgi:hypothetical protein